MSGIVIHKEFAYPVAAAVSSVWLLAWQTLRVGKARSAAKIEYPQMYAEKAEAAANKEAMKFNCAQRAHQNTLEVLPAVLTTTLVAGLKYPVAAGALCAVWVFSRIFYTIGYSTGDPKQRYRFHSARLGGLTLLGLIGASTAVAVSFVRTALEL